MAGAAGHRASSSRGAFDSPGAGNAALQSPASGAPTAKASRITAAVRVTEMELLPRQILDMEATLKTKRELLASKRQRGGHDDLEAAMVLSKDIEEKQREVRLPHLRATARSYRVRSHPVRAPRTLAGRSDEAHTRHTVEKR